MSTDTKSKETIDWTRFTRRIYINAPIPSVYRALSTERGLLSWLLAESRITDRDGNRRRSNQTVQVGDKYEWAWFDGAREKGEILEANGKDRLAFTFFIDEPVIITLRDINGRTLVDLKQENIPDTPQSRKDIWLGCILGWSFYLTNLKSILEGGIDLREHEPGGKHLVNI